MADFIPLLHPDWAPRPPRSWGWDVHCSAWAFVPLSRDGMEHLLPMVAVGEPEGSAENNIAG